MRRFFVEEMTPDDGLVVIKGDEFLHLKKVLRLKKGDEVSVFNGAGVELLGAVDDVGKDGARIRIIRPVETRTESPVDITIIQALTKGDKPELVIQKATELGVNALCFYAAQRSIGLIQDARLARWRKVAIEAAKQCERAVVPEISIAADLKTAIEKFGDENLKLILWEGDKKKGIKEILRGVKAKRGVAALVGPEGGFSNDEFDEAVSSGFIPVGLGPRIVRAETAAIAAVAIIQYEKGGME